MNTRLLIVSMGLAAVLTGWTAFNRSTGSVVYAQNQLKNEPAPQAPNFPPLDPSIPTAEAGLIRQLQVEVFTLQRRVATLEFINRQQVDHPQIMPLKTP